MPTEATYQIWAIGVIVVLSGIFGGWTAFLVEQAHLSGGSEKGQHGSEKGEKRSLARYIALGLSATICVPLFLSLVQSALIPKIFAPDKVDGVTATPYSEFLIFGGICMLAAISARKFLDTLSDKVLRDVGRLEKKTDRISEQAASAEMKAVGAEKKAETASNLSNEIIDERDVKARQEPLELEAEVASHVPRIDLSDSERKALSGLMTVTFRTATGIGQDIGIPRTQVGDLLNSLAEKGLVERTTSPTTGGPRWRITPLGVAALR